MKQVALAGAGAILALALFSPVMLTESEGRVELPLLFEPEPPTVLFVGDIMLDRAVARTARPNGGTKLFDDVAEFFAEHDLVVANLEGTITNNASLSEVDNKVLRFTFGPYLAKVLSEAGIGAVSLANNHALDFGEFGFDDTKHYLVEAGIAYFGSPFNEQSLSTATDIHGKKICMVGYHELFRRDPSAVIQELADIELECDRSVVFAHWGVEYEHEPSLSQQGLAKLFVDAGADLIIGAHPHVVQPVEIYNNVAIFYSLGNFVFDQHWRPEVRRGVMVSVEFGERETTFNLLPVSSYLEATPAEPEVSAAVLADLGVDSATFKLSR